MVSSLPFRRTVLVHKKTKYQATSYEPANGKALKALNLLIAAANQHPFLRLRNFSGMKRRGDKRIPTKELERKKEDAFDKRIERVF